MQPTDFRNLTWRDLTVRLAGLRYEVYQAFERHGPGTTREISLASGIDILTLRPRTTELHQMGFLELTEDKEGHEGRYRALSFAWVQRIHEARRKELLNPQKELELL